MIIMMFIILFMIIIYFCYRLAVTGLWSMHRIMRNKSETIFYYARFNAYHMSRQKTIEFYVNNIFVYWTTLLISVVLADLPYRLSSFCNKSKKCFSFCLHLSWCSHDSLYLIRNKNHRKTNHFKGAAFKLSLKNKEPPVNMEEAFPKPELQRYREATLKFQRIQRFVLKYEFSIIIIKNIGFKS